MSKYEGLTGKGKVTKKAVEEMQKSLMEIHNKIVGNKTLSQMKESGIKKATTETTYFPFLERMRDGRYNTLGGVELNVESGEFDFYVNENNRAVEDAEMTFTYKEFMKHLRSIPNKGKEYGAYSCYTSEYQVGMGGSKNYYGSWKQMRG